MTTVLCLGGTKSSALRRIASAMESAGILGWLAYEKSHPRCRLLPFCPRTLIGISPVDLCVTTGDHLLLHVRLSKEQLCHGSSVAVVGDPSDSNLLAHSGGLEQLWLVPAQLSCQLVQECRCRRVEPVLLLWWCRYRRRSRRRLQRMQELQGASVTWLGVTNDWVTSTRTLDPLSEVDSFE